MSENDIREELRTTNRLLFWLCLILIPGAATLALQALGVAAALVATVFGLVAVAWIIRSRPARMAARVFTMIMQAGLLIFAGMVLCYSLPMTFAMLASHDPGMRIGGVIAVLCFAAPYWLIARSRKRARATRELNRIESASSNKGA
jgi:hypothetical protein